VASPVSTANYTILIPESPIVLTALAVSGTEIHLSWTAATAGDVTGYSAYRGTSSGGELVTLLTTVTTGTTYADKTVTSGTTNSCVVTAVNCQGTEESVSNEASTVAIEPPITLGTGNGGSL